MGNLSVIGKVHIKDINALREWYAAGDFKKWHKVNWSPELAAYHHIKWEDTDLFCPGEKAVSFVKVSRSGIGYKNHEKFANMLQKYEKYHGHTIGILVKDGENLYMGWTDEDRINIQNENIFFAPQEATISQETEETYKSTSREEKISRFFIFALLQGLVNDGKLIHLP